MPAVTTDWGATAEAAKEVAILFQPLVGAAVSNRFERLLESELAKTQAALDSPGNADDFQRVGNLLSFAGYPPGIVSPNECTSVPTAHLNQLLTIAAAHGVLRRAFSALAQEQGK